MAKSRQVRNMKNYDQETLTKSGRRPAGTDVCRRPAAAGWCAAGAPPSGVPDGAAGAGAGAA